jgi:hypothetical protein
VLDGKRHGVWETHHASGALVKSVRYESGVAVE